MKTTGFRVEFGLCQVTANTKAMEALIDPGFLLMQRLQSWLTSTACGTMKSSEFSQPGGGSRPICR